MIPVGEKTKETMKWTSATIQTDFVDRWLLQKKLHNTDETKRTPRVSTRKTKRKRKPNLWKWHKEKKATDHKLRATFISLGFRLQDEESGA